MKKIIFISLIALLCFSCEKEETPTSVSHPITLAANIVSLDPTRSSADGVYTGTSAVGMSAMVCFANSAGVYPHSTSPAAPTYIPYHTTIKYENGPTTAYVDWENKNQPLTYPTDNSPIYCVGLYPNDGYWTFNGDNTIASHDISDAKTDIMFAAERSGTWETPFSPQTYKHKLMWIELEANATSPEAIEHWGKIDSVELLAIKPNVDIQLSTGKPTFNGTPTNIQIVKNFALSVSIQQLGSLLCAPANSLTLRLKTENVDTPKEVTVYLKDINGDEITGSDDEIYAKTAGRLFIISLYFNKFNNIDATCNLIPWNEQNVDLN